MQSFSSPFHRSSNRLSKFVAWQFRTEKEWGEREREREGKIAYWMNKMCGCWTPIRDTQQRRRAERTQKWNRLLVETKLDTYAE
jgi:hypothetical protein